jgi:hypothetical protein
MLAAKRLLADGKGALVERLGLGVAALGAIERTELVEGLSDVGMAMASKLDGKVRPSAFIGRAPLAPCAAPCASLAARSCPTSRD